MCIRDRCISVQVCVCCERLIYRKNFIVNLHFTYTWQMPWDFKNKGSRSVTWTTYVYANFQFPHLMFPGNTIVSSTSTFPVILSCFTLHIGIHVFRHFVHLVWDELITFFGYSVKYILLKLLNLHISHTSVSYTHLDVYKRQLLDSSYILKRYA